MNFLKDSPSVSHALTAFVLTLIILPIFYFMGVQIFGWLTFAIVATYFYGRESGQNDHDCVTNEGYGDTVSFLGNLLPILFTHNNWNQFVAPAITSFVVAATGQYYYPQILATIQGWF